MLSFSRFICIALLIGFLLSACGDSADEPPQDQSEGVNSSGVFDQFKQCYGDGDKTINLTTLNWQPYIGVDMRNYGPIHELVVAAYNRQGYRVCTAFFTWERTNTMGIAGQQVDGYFPEYYSKDYEEVLVFSKGYPAGPAGFYKRADKDLGFQTRLGMEDFHALQPYRIGVVRGYVNTAPLDAAIGQFMDDIEDPEAKARAGEQAYLNENRDPADSDEQNLEKLYNDRVQLVFIDPNVAKYHINNSLKRRYPDIESELEFMTPPLIIHKVYTCISRSAPDYERKIADFNAGLDAINRDGTLRKIMESHGFQTTDGVNYQYVGI
ncbi:MAG: ABC transporter substrate-binding protein [Leptospiraceae bacterium]|nr:ABC transporter substrate-binding protein [Leptospiraceae bacterium]